MRTSFQIAGSIVGGGPRPRTCSTKGCRHREAFVCDAPRERPDPEHATVGDSRVHLEHRRVFYVRLVHEGGTLTVSLAPPGSKELKPLRTISVADWFAKTRATCDEPICERCAKQVGVLDYCKEHQDAEAAGPSTPT